MPKVACIMMQKDERFLLKPWLAYYGHLFGFENLFVFDNGSMLAEVRDTLAEYEQKGVKVDRAHASREAYKAKGDIIGEQIGPGFATGIRLSHPAGLRRIHPVEE